MLKCPRCHRITAPHEPTGQLVVYKKLSKGRDIISSTPVCMNCNGEKYGN